MKRGTLALSWGPYGGFYVHPGYCKRICLGRLAFTYVPVELDDLMEAYAGPWYIEPEGKRESVPTR